MVHEPKPPSEETYLSPFILFLGAKASKIYMKMMPHYKSYLFISLQEESVAMNFYFM